MGAGKSTIGRQLAEALGLEFADTDLEIQQRTGVDIPTVFDFEGEAGFRCREKQVIDELTQRDRVVLATGGGAVLDDDNRRRLRERGLTIYLRSSPEQQFARTRHDRNRPLLQTEDPLARLRELMQQREPLYRETADWVVSTQGRSAQAAARDILKRLKKLSSD